MCACVCPVSLDDKHMRTREQERPTLPTNHPNTQHTQEYARRASHQLHPLTEAHFLAHPFGKCLASAALPAVSLVGEVGGQGNPGAVSEVWELLHRLPYRQRYALYK